MITLYVKNADFDVQKIIYTYIRIYVHTYIRIKMLHLRDGNSHGFVKRGGFRNTIARVACVFPFWVPTARGFLPHFWKRTFYTIPPFALI